MKPVQVFWFKWMLNYSFGELLAIGAAAMIGRFLFINISNTPITTFTTVSILIIAGAAEGFIIGCIQWKSLSKVLLHFKAVPWIIITTLSAVVGWLLVLPPAIMLISFLTRFSLISNYYSIVYTALVGISFGALMGVPQFFIIKKFYKNALVWIFANVLGWMLSFLIVYTAMSMLSETSSLIYNLFLIIISCVLSGLVQGVVTGTSLHFLMTVKKEHERDTLFNKTPLSIDLK